MAVPAATTLRETRGRKTEQLIARVTPDVKTLVEQAAALSGRSLTDFVTQAVEEKALALFRDYETYQTWTLSGAAALTVANALTEPARPNPRLRALFDRTRSMAEGNAAASELDEPGS